MDQACPHHSPLWKGMTNSIFFFIHRLFTFILHNLFCLSVLLFSPCRTPSFSPILRFLLSALIPCSSLYIHLFTFNLSFVRSQDQCMTLLLVSCSFVFLSHLTNFCLLLRLSLCSWLCMVHFALRKNLLGSKRKTNNYYFAFILQVL